jgi:hypothetical protein
MCRQTECSISGCAAAAFRAAIRCGVAHTVRQPHEPALQ